DDYFGDAVSGAEDVNGDGYDDAIVGAYLHDFGGNTDAGAAYIFYGGSSMDSIFDVKMGGEAKDDYFGGAVSGAGDVNGNGYDDVIVGAHLHDFGGNTDAGAVYIYDFYEYMLVSPVGGETLNVGAVNSIKWYGTDMADIYLSVDGGNKWDILVGEVGGEDYNIYYLRVPHIPSRYCLVKVAKNGADANDRKNYAVSDSFFTIQSTIGIKYFVAKHGDESVELSWQTEPGVPEIAGYNIYRADEPDADFKKINHEIITDSDYLDKNPGIGTMYYQLGAVNGWGREYIVANTSTVSFNKPLVIFPSPFVSGKLTIGYWVPGPQTFGANDLPVALSIYTIDGRLVTTIMFERKKTGFYFAEWNGKDNSDKAIKGGVYFLRLEAGSSYSKSAKLIVIK
ncbi:FG-GAP repeat protein, partial [candidate division WOR-3 bacterium]|nr:FG-GAP repeat protein [candidate division WOR-3 bacterium]